ncbi:hypothetical protein UFOVP158_28 [uncultured Caudovirales phage]|uniref:Uncharacterized protein n=1 Tax=uncultured Caudovirales phage TaxID=2100421 RepID=A0A6J7W954_9CAUD|nr:hypothetical protein UFOVP158_28 [uncultured Caudovirales phage]
MKKPSGMAYGLQSLWIPGSLQVAKTEVVFTHMYFVDKVRGLNALIKAIHETDKLVERCQHASTGDRPR